MDVAREYTEKWHHTQQIFDATGRPSTITGRDLYHPRLDTFMRAMSFTFRSVDAEVGAVVAVAVSGEAGGNWSVERRTAGWVQVPEPPRPATSTVILRASAFRRFWRPGGLWSAGTLLVSRPMNAIYLRRRSKVVLPDGSGATPVNVLATLQKNLEGLGFLLAGDVIAGLQGLSSLQADAFYQRLVKDLHALFGLHVRAHDEVVEDIGSARAIFSLDRGVTPFDLDRIAAESL